MTRNKAVNIIIEGLRVAAYSAGKCSRCNKFIFSEQGKETLNTIANEVLTDLEEEGMAPPEVKGSYHSGKILKRYWENDEA